MRTKKNFVAFHDMKAHYFMMIHNQSSPYLFANFETRFIVDFLQFE